ncbi:MAG: SDR family oxidoreductase [Acidobacteria bacterium]|nr:SDR family oxidoreductase [Acidobacteriota bacterium]
MSTEHPAAGPGVVFDLTGRTALVTGASSGLGRRMALVLAHAGATVAVTARRTERLEALAAEHPAIRPFTADLALAAERERLVAEVEAALGPLDVLVNNAGVANPKPIEQETLEDFTAMVEINLTSAWHLTKLFGVGMVAAGRGSVVNIASMLGVVGATPSKQTGYPAAKAGLINLTRELGLQWARRGVRVNAICPGWFATEMTDELLSTEAGVGFIAANTPMQRAGEVHEIDGPLLLLASDASSFMTGSILLIDGGWTAR